MKMADEEKPEMLSHILVIDDNMILEWKIPKVITPLQLKAMVSKVNKLFNLSEVQIVEEQPQPKMRKTNGHWTVDTKDKVMSMYLQGSKPRQIAETLYEMTNDPYFKDTKVVHQQLNYLKSMGHLDSTKRENVREEPENVPQEIKVKGKKTMNIVFNESDITRIVGLWVSGKRTAKVIMDELNRQTGKDFTIKQVQDKLYQLKVKGVIANE
jgi:hypothetical protein